MENIRRNKRKLPTLPTASLPDIVFMLLFFFMTVTTIKDEKLLVTNELPNANNSEKLEKKDQVIEIFVGEPNGHLKEAVGSEPKIQLNKALKTVEQISPYVLSELAKKPEGIRNLVTVSLKVDKNVSIGLIADIKEELQKINVLKVNYTTFEGESFKNLN